VGVARKRTPHRPLRVGASHWRSDGAAKVRYSNRAGAEVAAAERSRESGTELGAYACDYCGGWHMGRPSPDRD
jgi:hypothetical protein